MAAVFYPSFSDNNVKLYLLLHFGSHQLLLWLQQLQLTLWNQWENNVQFP